MSKLFNIILAVDIKGGIGFKNKLPWKYSKDLKHFKKLTSHTNFPDKKNCILMGRKTWESCGELPNRLNIVITKQKNLLNQEKSNTIFCESVNHGLKLAESNKLIDNIWVIGGSQIYKQCFNHHKLDKIYLTRIKNEFICDAFVNLPKMTTIDKTIIENECIEVSDNYQHTCDVEFSINKVTNNCENQYLNLLEEIKHFGIIKNCRNGNTKSLINKQLKWDLDDGFPLITTKKMYWKGIVEELLFFLRGHTNTKLLEDKKGNIWKGNTNREFLDKNNFYSYPEGQMGPMYGYQWRFFNRLFLPNLSDMKYLEFYNNEQGIDQLSIIINKIKNNPNSRRILMTNYNPLQVEMGVLYPCHSLILQFIVYENRLHVSMVQRSADVFLGLPFNIASTSLLLCIISKLTNYEPGTVTINIGDCHIYEEHLEAVNKQLERIRYNLPKLVIPDFETITDVENSNYEDYKILDYNSYPKIKAKMIA